MKLSNYISVYINFNLTNDMSKDNCFGLHIEPSIKNILNFIVYFKEYQLVFADENDDDFLYVNIPLKIVLPLEEKEIEDYNDIMSAISLMIAYINDNKLEPVKILSTNPNEINYKDVNKYFKDILPAELIGLKNNLISSCL